MVSDSGRLRVLSLRWGFRVSRTGWFIYHNGQELLGLEVADRAYIVFVHPVLVLSQADSYLGLVGYCDLTVGAGCAGLPAALGPQRPAGCSRPMSPALVTVGLAMYRVVIIFFTAYRVVVLVAAQVSLVFRRAWRLLWGFPCGNKVRFCLTFTPSVSSTRHVGQ